MYIAFRQNFRKITGCFKRKYTQKVR